MKRLMQWACQRMEKEPHPCCMLLIDIDFFLRYAMRLSAAQSTEILNRMTQFFLRFVPLDCLRREEDAFALLLPGYSKQDGTAFAQRLRQAFRQARFAQHCPEPFGRTRMSFSAGIACVPLDGTPAQTVKRALTALFLAKAMRRNRVEWMGESRTDTAGKPLIKGLKVELLLGAWGETGDTSYPIPRESCRLLEPQAICTDRVGRLYLADTGNHRILCCSNQMVFPVAGNGTAGYSGDGGPATAAQLNKPTGLAVVGTTLWITDTGNDALRTVDLRSGIISTCCGDGSAGYSGDGGPAAAARLNKPGGVAVRRGMVYVNDIANNVIRRIDGAGQIDTFAGTGQFGFAGDGANAKEAAFDEIYNVWADGQRLYLADYRNHRVRCIDCGSGRVHTAVGCGQEGYAGDTGPPDQALLSRPCAVCTDHAGNLLIAESGNHAVRIVLRKTRKIYTLIGGLGPGTGFEESAERFALCNPNGLCVFGKRLYILDGANNRVLALTLPSLEEVQT